MDTPSCSLLNNANLGSVTAKNKEKIGFVQTATDQFVNMLEKTLWIFIQTEIRKIML
jgi:hypothetical protein